MPSQLRQSVIIKKGLFNFRVYVAFVEQRNEGMEQPQFQNQPPSQEPDEAGIDLRKLFGRLSQFVQGHYRRLRLWLALGAVAVIAVFVLGLFLSPPMTTYSEAVAFTFPQSEKGRYPNGSPFSITDIASRNVLDQVWRENKLESQGVGFKSFVESVSVTAYADNEAFIRAKYQGMLARKNLNSADISTMEKDYRSELETQARKQALITLTVPFSSPISGQLARKVLSDIPKAWSLQAINQLGVVSIPIAENESVKDEILKKGSPFQVVDYFYKSADGLQLALNRIAAYPGGETLVDPDTGLSIEDLKRRVADLNRYWILDFDNYVQQRNQASEIDIRSAEIRLKELQDKKLEYLAEAKTYRASLQDYDSLRQQNMTQQEAAIRSQQGGSGLQLQGDAVQKLIDLGGQSKDTEFRQEMVKKRVEAELRANAMDQEIQRLDRRIQAARKQTARAPVDQEKMSFYTTEIWNQLSGIAASVKRIQAVQIARFSDDEGQLYSAGGVSKAYASGVAARFFLPIGLLVLLGLMGFSAYLINRLNHTKD